MNSIPGCRIGNLRLPNRIFLAPMAGVTNSPFRRICKRFGCSLVHSEMVNARGLVDGNRSSRDYMKHHHSERPISIQLYGHDPETMGKAAAIVSQTGNAMENDIKCGDVIDINMGCPAPKVSRTGAGGALLKDPALACEIMEAVLDNAGGLPVTVKMRTGWDQTGSDAFLDIAKRAGELGISAVTLHPRTVTQFFSGSADWNSIRRLVESVDVPVIGSGDLMAPRDAGRMLEETGCHAVMVARGIQGNPWLIRDSLKLLEDRLLEDCPTRIESPDAVEFRELAIEHARLNVEHFGEDRGIRDFRKHLMWYLKGKIPKQRKSLISRVRTIEEVERFFESSVKM